MIARNFKTNHQITRKSRGKNNSYDKNYYASESEPRNGESTVGNSPVVGKPKNSHFDQFYESFNRLNHDNKIKTEQNSPRQLLDGKYGGRNFKKTFDKDYSN